MASSKLIIAARGPEKQLGCVHVDWIEQGYTQNFIAELQFRPNCSLTKKYAFEDNAKRAHYCALVSSPLKRHNE